MKNISLTAKVYILLIILIGLGLIAWMAANLNWSNTGLYVLAALAAAAQTYKAEGPNARTNYNIAWFVYGFAFVAFGLAAALFVIVIAHLVEWAWHKYPWYIQSFNIGNHVVSVFLAGLVFKVVSQGPGVLDFKGALGLVLASLVFILANHFLVGLVVKLARGQSFAQSGVFEFIGLCLDFTILSMGSVTALVWQQNPFASLLNILPLYLLYQAIRVPALLRQVKELKEKIPQPVPGTPGD